MAIGHQSFYQTALTSGISASDLIIPLDTVPTVSEGFLVIESTVQAKREIIYFTSKDATTVTCPSGAGNGRGYDGTTAVSHLQGATVIMAPVGAMFEKLGDITVNSITIADTTSAEGWSPLGDMPDVVTALGNRSYSLQFNGNDLTDTVSEGMRLRTARTQAVPVQCASLNGSTQFFNRLSASLAGIAFTDDFVVSAWVKISSYGAVQMIASRYNGTSGWAMWVDTDGTVILGGYNAGSANKTSVASYQSVPLNKWVHLAAQLDMSTAGVSTTTSYIMFDGVDVPCSKVTSGTAPSALIQAGNLEIGSRNAGTLPFGGKLAQVAIYSAKVTQATILASMNQGITGAEPNLAAGYSLSNSLNDLSPNANNLTAQGSVVTTNADSPFGNSGVSTTLDYGIVMAKSFSTNTTLTVQVPEGCTIPSTGGVSTVDYSTQNVPYGFPRASGKWRLVSLLRTQQTATSNANFGSFMSNGWSLFVPKGEWNVGYEAGTYSSTTATGTVFNLSPTSIVGVTKGSENLLWSSQVVSAAASTTVIPTNIKEPSSVSTAGYWVMYTQGATTSAGIDGDNTRSLLVAENAYL